MDLSVQDLIDQFGVRNIDKECTKEDILAFGDFCHPWKQVGFYLNLTEAQLSAIDEENRTVPLKRLGVLQKWKSRFAFRATYRVLVTALLKCEKTDEARKVFEILAQREGGVAPVTAAQLASSSRPTTVTSKLDLVIDAENRAPKHLGQIADSMYEWEGTIADELGLAHSEVAAITKQHPIQLKLQARAALLKWKETNGSAATYRNLIGVFERAGYQGCADTVRKIALSSERKRTYESTEHSEISQPKKKHKGSSSSEGTCHSSVDLSATSHTSHVQPMSHPPLDNICRSFSNTIQATHLKLIKWTERASGTKRFYLMEKIENKWRDIGQLTGLSLTQLESIATEHRDKPIECCRTVLGRWMDNPPREYPTTWDGLIELLEDCQLTHVAEELKIVLSKANLT